MDEGEAGRLDDIVPITGYCRGPEAGRGTGFSAYDICTASWIIVL